jgi:diguanylate cyclase (GGDEF)-like protein/PAS domain S-box-containing protein
MADDAPLRQRIWAWLLPPERFPRSDGFAYQKAAATVLLAAGGALILAAFTATQLVFDARLLAVPSAIAACGMIVLLISFRRTARSRLYGNALCALVFSAVIATEVLSGGRITAPIVALPTLVFLASLALDRIEAILWAALSIAIAISSFLLMRHHAHAFIEPAPAWVAATPYRAAIGLCTFSTLIALVLVGGYRVQQVQMVALRERDRRRRSELDAQRERFEDFAAVAADGFWETDAEHRLTYMSPGYAEMFGLTEAQMLGRTPFEIAQSLEPRRTLSKESIGIGQMLRHEAFHNQRLPARGARGTLVLNNSGRPVVDAEGRFLGFRGAVVDITEMHRLNKELRRLAESDPLTGLANRRSLRQTIEAQLHQEPPGWLLCMDLDQFKQVNDAFGHEAGDRLLVEVARILRDSVRGDDLVARMGGDEFAVVLVGGNQIGAELVAARVLKGLKDIAALQPEFRNVSASIGLSTLAGVTDVDTALMYADGACYLAKRSGRARYMLAGD